MRIDARSHHAGFQLRTIFKSHAAGAVLVGMDCMHRCFAANLDAEIGARLCDRIGQSPHAPLHVTPHATRTARFAHHVMEQHIRAPRCADAERTRR